MAYEAEGINPYFSEVASHFKTRHTEKASMEINFRPEIVSEYTELMDDYIGLAAELLKLGVMRKTDEKSVILTIDSEEYSVPKADLQKELGSRQWDILFPDERIERITEYVDYKEIDSRGSRREENRHTESPPPNSYAGYYQSAAGQIINPLGALLTALISPFISPGYASPPPQNNFIPGPTPTPPPVSPRYENPVPPKLKPEPVVVDEPDILDEVSGIQRRINRLEKERSEAVKERDELQKSFDALKVESDKVNEDNKKIIEDKDKRLENSDRLLSENAVRIDELTQENIRNAEANLVLKEDNDALLQKLSKSEGLLKQKADAINDAEKKINEAEQKIKDTTDAFDRLGGEYAKCKSETESYKKETDCRIDELNGKINDLTQKNSKLAQELDGVRKECSSIRKDKDTLATQLQTANSQLQSSNAQLQNVANQLQSERNNVRVLNNKVADLERQLTESTKKSDELKNANAKAKTDADARQQEEAKKLAELKEKSDKDVKRLNELQDKLKTVYSEKDAVKKDLDKVQKEKENLQGKIKDLEHEDAEKSEYYKKVEKESAKLKRLAYVDQKTDVMNLNAFNRDFADCDLATTVLIMIGTRNLKAINAMHGRDAGNNVIGQVSSLLRKYFNKENVYRIMGDQFVVIVKNGNLNSSNMQMSKIRSELNANSIDIAYGIAFGAGETDYGVFLGKAEAQMNNMKNGNILMSSSGFQNGYQTPLPQTFPQAGNVPLRQTFPQQGAFNPQGNTGGLPPEQPSVPEEVSVDAILGEYMSTQN